MKKKFWDLEGRRFMGRVMPRELLEGIGKYLQLRMPERKDDLLSMIRTRAEELAEADKDLPVDGQSEGFLAITSTVFAAYEVLLPIFDDDERRTTLFLQHVVGKLLRRPYEVATEALGEGDDALVVRVGRQLDAGGRSGGQRTSCRAKLAHVAGRRRVPVQGGGDGRSTCRLHRQT